MLSLLESETPKTKAVRARQLWDDHEAQAFSGTQFGNHTLGAYLFAPLTLTIKASPWARLTEAAVGHEQERDQLPEAAERVINLERMVNARFGFDRRDDTLPPRFVTEPAADKRDEGKVVDLSAALDSYYAGMGWDVGTGIPNPEALKRLGLDWLF